MTHNDSLTATEAIQLYNLASKQSDRAERSLSLDTVIPCRICREFRMSKNQLIDCPCSCKGTIGKIHKQCLIAWTKVQQSNICEVCKCEFNLKATGDTRSQLELCTIRFKRFFQEKYLGFMLQRTLCLFVFLPIMQYGYKHMGKIVNGEIVPTSKIPLALPLYSFSLYSFSTAYVFWLLQSLMAFKSAIGEWWYNTEDEDDVDDAQEEIDDFFDIIIGDDVIDVIEVFDDDFVLTYLFGE